MMGEDDSDGDQPMSVEPATDAPYNDEFMYEFLRLEMKRKREQRRAMRREKTSLIDVADRYRETERYRRELDEGQLTVTPEQVKEQKVNLMPHFEGVQLHDYPRKIVFERSDTTAHRGAKQLNLPPGEQDEKAREKASKQYKKVAMHADLLVKHMQARFEQSARKHTSRGGTSLNEKKREDDDAMSLTTSSENRLREVIRQLRRDMAEVTRNIDIIDEQIALFARARERLDLRYRAAVGTRPDFLNDILLMTGGRPDEPYI
jgi:hypothetical protein